MAVIPISAIPPGAVPIKAVKKVIGEIFVIR
jgi:hypothetical protein